jgi:hypothetical protein
MAASWQLDSSRRSPAALVIALLLIGLAFPSPHANSKPPSQASDSARIAAVEKLYGEKRWPEAARSAHGPVDQPAKLDYLEGMSLAHLDRWKEAREAFTAAHRKNPADPRYLVERAGAEYRLNDFKFAKEDLREALRLGSRDPYVCQFLGTLYLLEGNTEAALKYWNAIQQPRLQSVKIAPLPRLRKSLLDRAIAFSPAGVFKRDSFLETNALLSNLGIFPAWRMELQPEGSEDYSATVHLSEESGWGNSWLDGALTLLRGLPYETVYPEYANIGGDAANFDSLVRWDSQKRRVAANFSLPLFHDPAKRLRFFFDARNENWNLSQTFSGSVAPITDLNMRRFAGGLEFRKVENGWWSWSSGVEAISRSFLNTGSSLPSTSAPFFTDSVSFETWLGVQRFLIRHPQRRFTLEGAGEGRIGRGFANDLGLFETLSGSLRAHWFPQSRGDDYELDAELRGADTFGNVSLDQLFQLGVERDNDLWLRGHAGTTDGRKGRAPLGRRYLLLNADFNKTIYNGAFIRVQCGPFLDSGSIADPSGLFGSREWLWDAGAQMKIRVLGSVSVIVSYGWDLRNATGAFYAAALR